MNSRPMSRSLTLSLIAVGLLAMAPLAGAQPDQRQFSSDKPMEPFPPPAATAAEAGAEDGTGTAAGTATPAESVAAGGETRAWLDLQASGSAAVGEARPMPGEVADAVYDRYVNSFKHPIPEHFQSESSGSSDSGSSGSGGGSGSGGSSH